MSSTVQSTPAARSAEARRPSSDGSARRPRRFAGALSFDFLLLASLSAASIGFFASAYSISLQDPGYFSRQQISSFQPSNIDPITTGAIDTPGADPIPAPRVVRATPPVAADYQIVMVFEDEAILATRAELVRVKVGSVVPGLGTILKIDPSDTGGTVKASEAILRSVAH